MEYQVMIWLKELWKLLDIKNQDISDKSGTIKGMSYFDFFNTIDTI